MKLVGKVPVEPLDDERLTNIERRLVVHVSEMSQQRSFVRAPRRLLGFAAVALAVVVAGVIGWKVRGDGTPGTPSRADQPEQLAMKAGALDLGDAQITGTDFTVTRTAARVDIVMQPGRLALHVEHEPERLFVVKAGAVEIEDVGTRFTVDFDGTNVDVRVTEGEVKVKHAGKEFAVTATNAWTLELGPITIAQLEHQGAQVVASTQPAGSSAGTPTTGPNGAPDVAPSAASNTAATGSNASSAGSGAGSSAGSGAGSGAKKPRKSDARKALEEAALEPPDEAATDDPKAAISAYLERIKTMPEGDDKARVLYSIAVMEHRAKRDIAALRTLDGVLRRQGGPAYKAARWLNVRIRCMKAFDDECRIAAQKYLASFSDGFHAGVAVDILKEISRGE